MLQQCARNLPPYLEIGNVDASGKISSSKWTLQSFDIALHFYEKNTITVL